VLFIDVGFAILYFLLFFYAANKRDSTLATVTLALFTAAMYMYWGDMVSLSSGKPRGYFVDTFGVYAAIFSPFVFLYFIYVMYRILVKGGKNLLWWLSFGAFIMSLLLSFRQRIPIEIFALYLIIATPLIVSVFLNSYRVRLPKHRRLHKLIATLVMISLAFSCVMVFANHLLYPLFKEPRDHFAYRYHIVEEVATTLKKRGVTRVICQNERLALRLKFYGIDQGGMYELIRAKNGSIKVTYAGKTIESFALAQHESAPKEKL
jgi:hypothetical protein